ncbi:MAG: hypothetical protein VX899_15840 [Myxococcota bacterium]|nr:hypothetical protein [Myxococcota bacterium]
MRPSRYLPAVLVAVCAALAVGALPMLDEESYLDLAAQVHDHPWRPYDWWRSWQPWGDDPAGDTSLFAHPPGHWLWVSLWQGLLGEHWALRLPVALPWAAILGWSAGRLAESLSPRPHATALLWLGSPIVLLGLQLSLMVDLPFWSLSTLAMALWVLRKPGWAGAALSAACAFKYPALVLWGVWLPLGGREPKALIRAGLSFLAGFALVQGFVFASTGQLHLLHVLGHADEIGRGPLLHRGVGVLARLGLSVSPVAALGVAPLSGLGGLAGLSVFGEELDGGHALLFGLTAWGGVLVAHALNALRTPEDRLPALWALLTIAAVLLGHNYAGGRYLLPATLPLALLLSRGLARFRPRWVAAMALPWALLGGWMVHAERQQARAWEAAALEVSAGPERGVFTGEWTFRYVMRQQGWTFRSAGPLEPGTLIARPVHAGPGTLGLDAPVLELFSAGAPGLRLTDLERGIGYHAETLGPRPLGWSEGPASQVTLRRVEPE